MRRVLSLLVDAAMGAGWTCELWTRGDLQPEFAGFRSLARLGPESWRDSAADVLWCPGLVDKPTHLPVVSTIHDINPLLPDGRPLPARLWRRFRFMRTVRANIRRSWRIVADTNFAKDSVGRAFPELCGRMPVVPLYVDQLLRRAMDPERDAILARLNLSPGYVLFVGSLRKHKNWDGLLRAYAAMPESTRNAHRLVLAGPAHRAGRQASDLARDLGVETRLTVLGTVPDAEMAALYSGAALFAFPSFLEGFGLPPLEAMACGVPVVATNRTSVPEVLGDAALYVDPSDIAGMATALHRVLNDSAIAADLVRRGHVQSAAYSPERTAEAMRAILADARTKQKSLKC